MHSASFKLKNYDSLVFIRHAYIYLKVGSTENSYHTAVTEIYGVL